MKKTFFAVVACVSMVSAMAAVESFRMDLRAVKDATISELVVPGGTSIAVQKPSKNVKEGITQAYIYSDKGALTKEWKKFTLTFVPEEDGRVSVSFLTPGSSDLASIKPVLIDDIQVTGGKLKNGNFETLNGEKFAAWRMSNGAKVVTGNAAEGKNCAQVIYRGQISQAIYVSADEKVTISFQAKLAE